MRVTEKQLGTCSNLCDKKLMRSQGACRFILVLTFVVPTGVLLIASAQQRPGDSSRVIALEKKWTEAYKHREVTILSSLLAEDFVITVEDGSTYGKLGYISHSADSSVQVEIAELSELKVRFHGNVAVVTGAYHEIGTSRGNRYEYRDRQTDVWLRSPNGWQVISSHYSVPVKL